MVLAYGPIDRLLYAWVPALGTSLVACAVASVALSLGATSVATRPLKRLFRMAPVTMRRDLIKRMCKLTTLRVDKKFGQAEVEDDRSDPRTADRTDDVSVFQREKAV